MRVPMSPLGGHQEMPLGIRLPNDCIVDFAENVGLLSRIICTAESRF